MMRILILLLICTGLQQSVIAQSASDSVIQVVTDFFSAMKRSDTAGMRACLHPGLHLETTQSVPDSEPEIRQQSIESFFASVVRSKPGMLDERIQFQSVSVDGPLASVWTPYEFYYNGRYSHCGVNSFQLVRVKSRWLIQYLVDTRRRTCTSDGTSIH